MKKVIILFIFILIFSQASYSATKRIFTGLNGWMVMDMNIPGATWVPAETVSKNSAWDTVMGGGVPSGFSPWVMLYVYPSANWISMDSLGISPHTPIPCSTTVPCSTSYFYAFQSPMFYLESDSISRGTIWFSVDDAVVKMGIAGVNGGGGVVLIDSIVASYDTLHRIDITEQLRSLPPDTYVLYAIVADVYRRHMGIILYMSFDFDSTDTFKYIINDTGWVHLSIPCYPTNSGATRLSHLFPGADSVRLELPAMATAITKNTANVNLTGSDGDLIRTYSLQLHFPPTGMDTYYVYGIGIDEQYYAGLTCAESLASSTISKDSVSIISIKQYAIWNFTNSLYWPISTVSRDSIIYILSKYGYRLFQITPAARGLAIVEDTLFFPLLSGGGGIGSYSTVAYSGISLPTVRSMGLDTLDFSSVPDSSYFLRYIARRGSTRSAPKLLPSKKTMKTNYLPEIAINVYPNPFNSFVNINVLVTKKSKVDIRIYNIKGELVKNLFSGILNKGLHSITWCAETEYNRKLESGIYILKIASGKNQIQREILFVK